MEWMFWTKLKIPTNIRMEAMRQSLHSADSCGICRISCTILIVRWNWISFTNEENTLIWNVTWTCQEVNLNGIQSIAGTDSLYSIEDGVVHANNVRKRKLSLNYFEYGSP